MLSKNFAINKLARFFFVPTRFLSAHRIRKNWGIYFFIYFLARIPYVIFKWLRLPQSPIIAVAIHDKL